MAKIIVVANQKGGVGKTTTCVNLAVHVANKGRKVLLLDLDPQGNSCSGLGVDPNLRHEGIYSVFIGSKNMEDVITPSKYANLDIIPVSIDLAGAQAELFDQKGKEYIIKEQLARIKENYDLIIMDTPPSLALFTLNGLTAADSVLIPLQSEFYAMEGLAQLLQAIKLIKSSTNPTLEIEGVVITMFDQRTNLSKDVCDEAKSFFKDKVYDAIIPRNVRLSEAPSYGIAIYEYDQRSQGAKSYMEFGDEFIKKAGI
ncbi:MAG: ParA family protein [Brevinema sp.]